MAFTVKEKKNMSRLYFEEKYSYAAIARIYNTTRQRVHQIVTGYDSSAHHDFSFSNVYIKIDRCTTCLAESPTDIHHLDRNPGNNKPNNLIALCKECHQKMHKGKKKVKRLD